MAVELNHTIVVAHDAPGTAAFISEVLGLPTPYRFGPFLCIETGNGVSLDVMEAAPDHEIEGQHYAFLVSEEEFDEIFGRIVEREIPYFADPHAHIPQEINHHDGGRGCYFGAPNGHWLEIITRPYGSGT